MLCRVPREEDRIFLFLDLNSSTVLAEELGHIRYSELSKCCLADLALSVKKYKATVYQYVGDEAVLSWGGHLPAEGVARSKPFEVPDPFIIHGRGSMELRGKSGSHDLYTGYPY